MHFRWIRGIAAAALHASGAATAAAQAAPRENEKVVLDFEPGADEAYCVVGPWRLETAAPFVRSGAAGLRVTCGPPETRPGVRMAGALLREAPKKRLRVDVCNASPSATTLVIRVDGEGGLGYRRAERLAPGWTTVEIDFERLHLSAGKTLDSERLEVLSFFVEAPAVPVDLVFDHVRLVGGADGGAAARKAVDRFEGAFEAEKDPAIREGLVRSLAAADVPERARALDRLVLASEDESRHVGAALDVLATTVDDAAAAVAVDLATKASGRRRLRWIEACARMPAAPARRFVDALLAKKGGGPADVTALLARGAEADPSLLPLLDPSHGGSWQIQVARVAALRRLGLDAAFDFLVGHLTAESGRVRADAEEALTELCGRALGDRPEPWLAWRRASASRPARGERGAGRSGYGAYYGIPLSPGRTCFVIDVSGSMSAPLDGGALAYARRGGRFDDVKRVPTRLDLAKAELVAALEVLPPRAAIQIAYFSRGAALWRREGPAEATREMKTQARRFAERLGASGSTDLHGGLVAALEPRKSAAENFRDSVDTVFLLSDGQPTAGALRDPDEIVADVLDRNRGRAVRIHTVGLGEFDAALLRGLARACGGVFVDLSK
ncbi:MAG TPA: hypothetical protein VEI02_02990 [Planctomycetota bacterium]|nr:hypothetical protein [Planctomycetota bacterium]